MSAFRRPKAARGVDQISRRSSNQNRSPFGSAAEITLLPEEPPIPDPNVENSIYDVPLLKPIANYGETCDSRCWLKRNSLVSSHTPLIVTPPSSKDFVDTGDGVVLPPIYKCLGEWQTRLVVLHPGNDDQPLSCSLLETNVTEKNGLGLPGTLEIVAYAALSYSWGHGTRDHVIICNGQPLSVPAQAALALLYLRSKTEKRHIWCDAICIDQENPDEKAVQVRSMFRIFEKAERVIAWLGTPSPECTRLVNALLTGCDFELPRLWAWSEHQSICLHTAFGIGAALVDLLARPWFRRTWIRQEVYAASDLVLLIGPHMIGFRDFLQKAEYVNKSLHLVFPTVSNVGRPPTLSVYDREYQHAGYNDPGYKSGKPISYSGYWRQVLLDGAQFDVTDERDRVYGALGILINRHVPYITDAPDNIEQLSDRYPISYRKETSVVFQDVIKFLINEVRDLEIFDYFPTQHWYSFLRKDGMPSWTTNWAQHSARASFHRPMKWARGDFVKALQQVYSLTDKLRLEGMIAVRQLLYLDSLKEIRISQVASIRMGDPAPTPRRRSSGLDSDTLHISTFPCAFVFSYVGETSSTYEVVNEVVSWKEIGRDFAHHLAGESFIFGHAEDYPGVDSLQMQGFNFLLPRETMLDDIVVSLYGSKCLHLLRPLANLEDGSLRCQYIAPVVAFLVGQDVDRCPVSRSVSKRYLLDSGSRRTRRTFELV